MTENPYAPPTTNPARHSLSSNTDIVLKLDGYRYGKQLLVNQHFKTPPICVKRGIPTSNPPKSVTITRLPAKHPITIELIRGIVFIAMIGYLFYSASHTIGFITAYCIFSAALTKLTTKPYQIKLAFSDSYRKRTWIKIFIIIGLIIWLISAIYMNLNSTPHIIIPLIPFVVLLIFLVIFIIRKSSKFIVVKQSGEYYYLKGAHRDFLAQLPDLKQSLDTPY